MEDEKIVESTPTDTMESDDDFGQHGKEIFEKMEKNERFKKYENINYFSNTNIKKDKKFGRKKKKF